MAAVAASPLPSNLPEQSFEAALAPLLDIAACDGIVDRIQGFEPFMSAGQTFVAIKAAPGGASAAASEYDAPVIGPLDGVPSVEKTKPFIGRQICVAIFS